MEAIGLQALPANSRVLLSMFTVSPNEDPLEEIIYGRRER
jgi:hypothetical protein